MLEVVAGVVAKLDGLDNVGVKKRGPAFRCGKEKYWLAGMGAYIVPEVGSIRKDRGWPSAHVSPRAVVAVADMYAGAITC